MTTCCKDCVFAIYEGITQTSCKMNMVSRYLSLNLITECYDEDKEFYVINNTYCPFYRDRNKWKYSSVPFNEQKTVAIKESSLRYELFLIVDNVGIDEIEYTIKQINNVLLKPQKLVVVLNCDLKPQVISSLCREKLSDINWRIDIIFDRTEDNKRVDYRSCIDIVFKKMRSQYYCVIFPGLSIHPKAFSILNKLILYKHLRFTYIKGDVSGHGDFVPYFVHYILGGNYKFPLIDKIHKIAQETNGKHLIKEWTSLCQINA